MPFVLPPGFEPGTTVPKTVVISVSPRERARDKVKACFHFSRATLTKAVCLRERSRIVTRFQDFPNRSRIMHSPSLMHFRDPASASPSTDGEMPAAFDSPARGTQVPRLPASSCASLTSVRVRRIELRSRPWQGRVLPLNHARDTHGKDYTRTLALRQRGPTSSQENLRAAE